MSFCRTSASSDLSRAVDRTVSSQQSTCVSPENFLDTSRNPSMWPQTYRVGLWGVGPRTSCFINLPAGCDAFFPPRSLIPESQSHDPSHSQRPSPFIQDGWAYLLWPSVFKRIFLYRKFWSQSPLTHLLPDLPPHLWFTLVCFLLPWLSPHPHHHPPFQTGLSTTQW